MRCWGAGQEGHGSLGERRFLDDPVFQHLCLDDVVGPLTAHPLIYRLNHIKQLSFVYCSPLKLDTSFRKQNQGLPNRRQHGQETAYRSTPKEKWQIVQEGIKSGNVSETCRRHGVAPNLFYRWKDEAEQGAKAGALGRSAAAAETEKRPAHPAVGTDAGAEVVGD